VSTTDERELIRRAREAARHAINHELLCQLADALAARLDKAEQQAGLVLDVIARERLESFDALTERVARLEWIAFHMGKKTGALEEHTTQVPKPTYYGLRELCDLARSLRGDSDER
jgi:hypothetical protein